MQYFRTVQISSDTAVLHEQQSKLYSQHCDNKLYSRKQSLTTECIYYEYIWETSAYYMFELQHAIIR
jgi:hypothetical protein